MARCRIEPVYDARASWWSLGTMTVLSRRVSFKMAVCVLVSDANRGQAARKRHALSRMCGLQIQLTNSETGKQRR